MTILFSVFRFLFSEKEILLGGSRLQISEDVEREPLQTPVLAAH